MTIGVFWVALGLLSAIANTLLGAYGHNGVHRVHPHALGLDWNGLSSFEWLSEHVISYHPFVNTERDHDALSMEPILAWLPRRPGVCGRAQTSWMRHVVYTFSELLVALQGTCVQRDALEGDRAVALCRAGRDLLLVSPSPPLHDDPRGARVRNARPSHARPTSRPPRASARSNASSRTRATSSRLDSAAR